MKLTDYYQYESEEEKEKEEKQQISKKPDKKEPPKKTIKNDVSKFNKWVNKKETDINYELIKKYFKFQKLSDMLKVIYTTKDKKKSNKLVNMI